MKEKVQANKKNKKIYTIFILILVIILLIIFIMIFKMCYDKLLQKKNYNNSIISFANNNKETIFSIDKIVLFSSCNAKNKTSSKTNFTIENLYTYTDIAIFINNNSDENNLENTLKKVKLTDIKISKLPSLGNPNIYYKSIQNFAKSEFDEKNIINGELEYKITAENKIDFNEPILYNNCANPITLCYVNQNIKTDYTMLDTENPITYDGRLLKRCGISLDSINATISLNIEIENNKEQKFRTTIYFNIPYEDGENTIYNGSLTNKMDTNFKFYRYE